MVVILRRNYEPLKGATGDIIGVRIRCPYSGRTLGDHWLRAWFDVFRISANGTFLGGRIRCPKVGCDFSHEVCLDEWSHGAHGKDAA